MQFNYVIYQMRYIHVLKLLKRLLWSKRIEKTDNLPTRTLSTHQHNMEFTRVLITMKTK